MKDVNYLSGVERAMRKFPRTILSEVAHQIDRVCHGLDPANYKNMSTIGPGVREIRLKDRDGIYRLIYVAKFREAIYVLHAFQKKDQATPRREIDIAKRKYKKLLEQRRGNNE